jgi:hypothetical protein
MLDTTELTPSELEQRRRDIVTSLTTQYKGYDDPEIPLELLHELAMITSTLRRKNAGPPKQKRPALPKSKGRVGTIDDL